jgi:hypothetical protein
MGEPDECIEVLDKWIQSEKNTIYDENIKGPENSQEVLSIYMESLESFGKRLLSAIVREDIDVLQDFAWPDELLECIKDLEIRTVIMDRIEHWFIRYPFVKSKLHINELAAENAGLE